MHNKTRWTRINGILPKEHKSTRLLFWAKQGNGEVAPTLFSAKMDVSHNCSFVARVTEDLIFNVEKNCPKKGKNYLLQLFLLQFVLHL